MPFTLPDLPYPKDAFGDRLSAESFDYHHGKHHKAYVDKTNTLIAEDKALAGLSLVELIHKARHDGDQTLFNNAAQIWNHSFFWQCLSPDAGKPSGRLGEMIAAQFGSTDELLTQMQQEAVEHFGSGWAWLILKGDALAITALHDADTPVAHDMVPLLTLDVWEHAYYIDYRNARPDYAKTVLGSAINWEFVARNLDGEGVARADQPG